MVSEENELFSPLRSFEFRLIGNSISVLGKNQVPVLPSVSSSSVKFHDLIDELLTSIELGHYVQALYSDAARAIFKFDLSDVRFHDSADCADRFYSVLVPNCVTSFLIGETSEDGTQRSYRAFLVMTIAVAAFLAFTQCNMIGPWESFPSMPLNALILQERGGASSWVEWEAWARNELMSGSDFLGKFYNLQYLVFAKILLLRIKDLSLQGSLFSMYGNRSISWWLARVLLLQQKMLDELSSSLFDLLQVYMHESIDHFGTSQKVISYWGGTLSEEEALTVVSVLHLEVGIMELTYGWVDSSRLHFQTAELASGLNLSLSGALGFRTVHQVEPKAQLLLVAGTSVISGSGTSSSVSLNIPENDSAAGRDCLLQHHRETCETSDVLRTPRLLETSKNSEVSAQSSQHGEVESLKAVQQAVILAQCLSIEKNSRQDEMQKWEMAPYIEAIDSQQSSCFIIRCFCDVLRIRWESTRSRTKERALMMMDKLVQLVYQPLPEVAERICVCYGVHIPTIPALRKEYGDLLVSCGLIGEAVKVYEDLELWDNVIYCYSLLEKRAAAVELIKTQLTERPSDPRLWCSLGDVTNNDSCYEKALEVSQSRSARAKRSLARSAFNKGDYATSKILWEAAMAMNSLYPDGWFALGAAALKARDVDKALDAFTRAIQLDPENGEAWNNIACLHMVKKKSKEAFIAFKEALKFKRNSWQLWENYSHVAADVGNFGQAMEAVKMVLDMTNNKRIDVGILERMMLEVEERVLCSHIQSPMTTNNDDNDQICDTIDLCHDVHSISSAVDLARTPETEHLMQSLGKILQQIVKSGGEAETWGLFARWHKIKGDLTMCSEALLKQVRSYQGSNLWKDRDRFKKFANASLELCNVYMELASRTGNSRELLGAEMHLKNTIKQAGDFSETKEYRDLQAWLGKVQTRLQASSVSAA